MSLPNGGPPITDDIAQMPWVPWHIKRWLEGVRGLKWNEIGAYMQVLATLYDRMGDLPDDDRLVAVALGVDIRSWRTMRARLIELGKIDIRGGRIHNQKVEDEIAAYCTKIKNKRDAAEKREAAKRLAASTNVTTSQPISGKIAVDPIQNSPDSPAKVQQVLSRIDGDLSEKPNNYNGSTPTAVTTAVPELWHSSGLDKISKKESKKENQQQQSQIPRARTPHEVAAAAAALAMRLSDVASGALANVVSAPGLMAHSTIMGWLEAGADPDLDIVPAVRAVAERTKARGTQRITAWAYFNNAIADAKRKREAGLPDVGSPVGADAAARKRDEELRQLRGIVGRRV